jgi:molybdopterin converting factor small subunit
MAHWLTVAVNGEQEKEMEDQLSDGDEVLVFTGVSGG